MSYYYEYACTLMNRVGRMLPRDALEGKTGFRSYFGVSEQDSKFFIEAGTSRGFKHFSLYADELFIDFDDGEAEAERAVAMLTELGYGLEVYFSGSKGYHIHMKSEPMYSRHTPYSHKQFIKALGIHCDYKLYEAGRIFRLPGTRHAKTSKYKELVHTVEGKTVNIPLIEEPVRERSLGSLELDFNFKELANLMTWISQKPPKNGERNHRMFALAAGLLASGLSSTATSEIVEKLNLTLEEPLEDEELGLLLESACNSVGG